MLNLTAQNIPDGFVADVTLDRARSLDPLEVYENAIAMIKDYGATMRWETEGFRRNDMSLRGTHVEIMFRSLATPRVRTNGFQIGHVLLAIYQAVNTMAEESAFCNAKVTVSLHGQRVGSVGITKILYAPEISAANQTSNSSGINALDTDVQTIGEPSSSPTLTTRTNPYDFPEIVDPSDHDFKLTYNFDGPTLPYLSVLSAVLDAMVTIARPGPFDTCEEFHAYGIPGTNVMIYVSAFEQAKFPLRYGYISRALTLVWDILMRQGGEWKEISFEMWFSGEPFAIGFVTNLRAGVDGGEVGEE